MQYNLHQEASNEYMVTREFATAVCGLPFELTTAEEEQYWKFLDQWGTVCTQCHVFYLISDFTYNVESFFFINILILGLQKSGLIKSNKLIVQCILKYSLCYAKRLYIFFVSNICHLQTVF